MAAMCRIKLDSLPRNSSHSMDIKLFSLQDGKWETLPSPPRLRLLLTAQGFGAPLAAPPTKRLTVELTGATLGAHPEAPEAEALRTFVKISLAQGPGAFPSGDAAVKSCSIGGKRFHPLAFYFHLGRGFPISSPFNFVFCASNAALSVQTEQCVRI